MSHSFFNMHNFGVFTDRDNMIPNTYVSKINKITGNSNVESKVKPPQQVDQLWSRFWDQLILDPLSCNSSWIKIKIVGQLKVDPKYKIWDQINFDNILCNRKRIKPMISSTLIRSMAWSCFFLHGSYVGPFGGVEDDLLLYYEKWSMTRIAGVFDKGYLLRITSMRKK